MQWVAQWKEWLWKSSLFNFTTVIIARFILLPPARSACFLLRRLDLDSIVSPDGRLLFFANSPYVETIRRMGTNIRRTQRFLGLLAWTNVTQLPLVNGCLAYHRPIVINACPPKRCQSSEYTQILSLPSLESLKADFCSYCTLLFVADAHAQYVAIRCSSSQRVQNSKHGPPATGTILAWKSNGSLHSVRKA